MTTNVMNDADMWYQFVERIVGHGKSGNMSVAEVIIRLRRAADALEASEQEASEGPLDEFQRFVSQVLADWFGQYFNPGMYEAAAAKLAERLEAEPEVLRNVIHYEPIKRVLEQRP